MTYGPPASRLRVWKEEQRWLELQYDLLPPYTDHGHPVKVKEDDFDPTDTGHEPSSSSKAAQELNAAIEDTAAESTEKGNTELTDQKAPRAEAEPADANSQALKEAKLDAPVYTEAEIEAMIE